MEHQDRCVRWAQSERETTAFGWIGGNDADRDGLGGIEAIILQNDCRPRLACVILSPGDRPYFSTLQSVTRLQ